MNFNKIKIEFKNRKKIHYSLLILITVLQIIVLGAWYIESSNEKEIKIYKKEFEILNNAKEAVLVLKVSNVNSQNLLQKYLTNKNENNYNEYKNSITTINSNLNDVLSNSLKIKSLNNSKSLKNNLTELKLKLDSISNLTSGLENNIADLNFESYNANSVLNSIEVDTNTEKDTIKKKGFFGRIGGAISGKTDVQKEKTNVIIKMKYGNKVVYGDIKEQFKNILNQSNNFYRNKTLALKRNIDVLSKTNNKVLLLNSKIQDITSNIITENETSLNKLIVESKNSLVSKETKISKTRNFLIIILLIFKIVMTIILLLFTNLAFQYERRLIKAKDSILNSLKFKNRIVGMLSHEIRSPLSTISLVSRNAARRIEDEQIKEQVKSIEFTTNSLMLMSNQILQYSKSENAKLTLNTVSFNLIDELDNIFKSLVPIVESNNNTIEVKFSEIVQNSMVSTDLVKVHQLFYNIVGNANKFTQKGTIFVNLHLLDTNNNQLNLKVEIKDTGLGISKTEIENIFNDFYQGVNNEKVKDIGAGLGLNLCKEIVELLNGTITIESEINKGTIISFNLLLNKN